MKKFKQYIIKNWFAVCIAVILVLSFFLRFYNYGERFGLAYDQAHDAIVAHYAVENKLIPLVGPFSSAGPFQTGGEWYWFIMIGSLLVPNIVSSPWIFLTLTYILFVYFLVKVGEKVIDKTYGVIAGALAAVSTAQIAQGINLTNQGPQAIVALGAIWAAVSYIKSKKYLHAFLLGLFVSLAVSIHLQGVALYSLVVFTFIIAGRPKIKSILALVLGAFLPFIPILIFDLQNDFVNTSNMLRYFLHDQYSIPLEALGRRWLTYAGVFWPTAWGHIVGGSTILGYILSISVFLTALYHVVKRKITKDILLILVSFSAMFTILRYIRTPLYDSYLTFLHPFIFLLTAWVIYFVFKINRIVGLVVLIVVLGGSLYKDYSEITYHGNITGQIVAGWQKELDKKYPGEKFVFYDYKYGYRNISVPLVLYLYYGGKTDNNARRIGIGISTDRDPIYNKVLLGGKGGYQFFDLNASTSAQIDDAGWVNVNPSYIYNSTENWRHINK